MEFNLEYFKDLITKESCFATVVPILLTLAGLPSTYKGQLVQEFFKHFDVEVESIKNEGIGFHDMIACWTIDNEVLEYRSLIREDCYIYACYSLLKHRFTLLKKEEFFSKDDITQQKFFKDDSLNRSFKNLYMKLAEQNEPQRDKSPSSTTHQNFKFGFTCINIWDIGLSTAVFHFLPFLSGRLTSCYFLMYVT